MTATVAMLVAYSIPEEDAKLLAGRLWPCSMYVSSYNNVHVHFERPDGTKDWWAVKKEWLEPRLPANPVKTEKKKKTKPLPELRICKVAESVARSECSEHDDFSGPDNVPMGYYVQALINKHKKRIKKLKLEVKEAWEEALNAAVTREDNDNMREALRELRDNP